MLIVKRLVSLATARPPAPSRSVSLYILLVELLAGPEVVLLIRVQGSKYVRAPALRSVGRRGRFAVGTS